MNIKLTTLIHKVSVYMAFTVCLFLCIRSKLLQFNVAEGLFVL